MLLIYMVVLTTLGSTNGKKSEEEIFVLNNTNIDLHCPLPVNMSTWYGPQNKFIAIYGKVIQTLTEKGKYDLSMGNNNSNTLTVKHFSNDGEGIYRCSTNNTKGYEINLNLCRIQSQLKMFRDKLQTLTRLSGSNQNGLVCKRSLPIVNLTTEEIETYSVVVSFGIKGEQATTAEETPFIYECLLINEELCSLNEKFYLNTSWLFDMSNRNIGGPDVRTFSCKCNNTFCNELIGVFISEHVLYFQTWTRGQQEDIVCLLTNDVTNDVRGIQPMLYTIIAVSGVLVLALSLLLRRHIQGHSSSDTENSGMNPVNHNAAHGVSNVLYSEEYSSIERHHQLTRGQEVSYSVSTTSIRNPTPYSTANGAIVYQNDNTRHSEIVPHSTTHMVQYLQEQNLNYIDVQMNCCESRPVLIIGDDRRTPYADIDLALKADPLPESDSSSDENENDDDFVTLEELQALKRSRAYSYEEDC